MLLPLLLACADLPAPFGAPAPGAGPDERAIVMLSPEDPPAWATSDPGADPLGAEWWTARACAGDADAWAAARAGAPWFHGCPTLTRNRCAALTSELQAGGDAVQWDALAACEDPSLERWFLRDDAPDLAVLRWFTAHPDTAPGRLLQAAERIGAADPAALDGWFVGVRADDVGVSDLALRLRERDGAHASLLSYALGVQSDPRAVALCASEGCTADPDRWTAAHPLEDLDRTTAVLWLPLDDLVRRYPRYRDRILDAFERCAADGARQYDCLHALAAADRARAARMLPAVNALEGTDVYASLQRAPDDAAWTAELASRGIPPADGAVTVLDALEAAGRTVTVPEEAGWWSPGATVLLRQLSIEAGFPEPVFAQLAPSDEGPRAPRAILYGWWGGHRYRAAGWPEEIALTAVGLWNRIAEDAGRPERAALAADGRRVVYGEPRALAALEADGLVTWYRPDPEE